MTSSAPTLFSMCLQAFGDAFSQISERVELSRARLPPGVFNQALTSVKKRSLLRRSHIPLLVQALFEQHAETPGAELRMELSAQRKLDNAAFMDAAKLVMAGAASCVSEFQISTLDVSFCSISDDALDNLSRACGNSLSKLRISGCSRLSNAGVEAITRNCPNLSEVQMEVLEGIDDLALQHLVHKLTKLRTLNIGGCTQLSNVSFQVMYPSTLHLIRW